MKDHLFYQDLHSQSRGLYRPSMSLSFSFLMKKSLLPLPVSQCEVEVMVSFSLEMSISRVLSFTRCMFSYSRDPDQRDMSFFFLLSIVVCDSVGKEEKKRKGIKNVCDTTTRCLFSLSHTTLVVISAVKMKEMKEKKNQSRCLMFCLCFNKLALKRQLNL